MSPGRATSTIHTSSLESSTHEWLQDHGFTRAGASSSHRSTLRRRTPAPLPTTPSFTGAQQTNRAGQPSPLPARPPTPGPNLSLHSPYGSFAMVREPVEREREREREQDRSDPFHAALLRELSSQVTRFEPPEDVRVRDRPRSMTVHLPRLQPWGERAPAQWPALEREEMESLFHCARRVAEITWRCETDAMRMMTWLEFLWRLDGPIGSVHVSYPLAGGWGRTEQRFFPPKLRFGAGASSYVPLEPFFESVVTERSRPLTIQIFGADKLAPTTLLVTRAASADEYPIGVQLIEAARTLRDELLALSNEHPLTHPLRDADAIRWQPRLFDLYCSLRDNVIGPPQKLICELWPADDASFLPVSGR